MAARPTPLGQQLRTARLRRGLTTRQVAELTEGAVSEPAIRFIENGTRPNPRLSTLCALALALDVTITISGREVDVDFG